MAWNVYRVLDNQDADALPRLVRASSKVAAQNHVARVTRERFTAELADTYEALNLVKNNGVEIEVAE